MDRTLKTGDYIILGSEFTKRTFIDKGYKDNCLFVNQYGVNLKDFHFIKNINRPFDIIMVGNWSYMKGCNILTEAINKLKLKFLHVGSISDCPFPKNNLLFIKQLMHQLHSFLSTIFCHIIFFFSTVYFFSYIFII